MTTIIREHETTHGAEVLDALNEAVRDLRREIEELTKETKDGNGITETALAKPLKNARDLATQCAKAENYLNECRKKQAGIARGHYALDLEAARVAIGCKLDRLRRCHGATPVS